MKIEPTLKKKIEIVISALKSYNFPVENKPPSYVDILTIIRRPFSNSVILMAGFVSGSRKLIMKSVVHHPVNKAITETENQAVVEFDILTKLYPLFQDMDGCSVPEPILVLPEIETYVMEYVEGVLLENELHAANYLTSPKKFNKLQRSFFNCGRWLKRFQEGTGIHYAGPEVLDEVITRCDQQLEMIEYAKDKKCPTNLREDVMLFLRENQALVKNDEVIVSGRHGDFGPWNIIAEKHGITVIDYLGYREAPIAVDLLKMLMNFDNDEKALLTNSARIKELKQAFLEGYGTVQHISESVMIICETYHRAASLESAINNKAMRFHRSIERKRIFKSNLQWLINDRGREIKLMHNV